MMIRSTFHSFETARRAVTNAQFGLDVTGNNVANVNTPGYTRQRLDQVSFAIGGRARFSMYGQVAAGQGSIATGISRMRDPYLDARYRGEVSDTSEYSVIGDGLGSLNGIFDETLIDGLHAKLEELYTALNALEQDPNSSEYATQVRAEAEQVAQLINSYNNQLQTVREQQVENAENTVEEANLIIQEIAKINEQIYVSQITGQPANELQDMRDMLVDQLAEYVDIDVVKTGVKFTDSLTVEVWDINLKGSGQSLVSSSPTVSSENYNQLQLVKSPASPPPPAPQLTVTSISYDLVDSSGTPVTTNIPIGGAALKAYTDLVNGDGTPGNDFRGITYYQNFLDDFATQFVNAFNDINLNQSGVTPAYHLFYADPYTAPPNDPAAGPAATIRISDEWRNDVNVLLTSTDPNSSQTDLLEKFKKLLDETQVTAGGTTYRGFQEYFTATTGQLAMDQKLNATMYTASFKVLNSIADQRDAVSAVSENDEAVNMMMYKSYFDAASRYLTTLDEALNTIINNMGIVGR